MAYAQGLRPVQSAANMATYQIVTMEVASDYNVALFVGDPVVAIDSGALARTATNIAAGPYATATGDGTYPLANRAGLGAANVIYGVITSIQTTYSNLETKHIAASTGGFIQVCRPTSETLFICGEDTTTTALTLADIGLSADLEAGAGGSTVTGYSSVVMTSADAATTAQQVLIRGVYNEPGNIDDLGTTDMKWLVSILPIQFAAAPVGVGV